jgi:hypothetical protein
MAHGGARPGSGPAKGTKYRPRGTKAQADAVGSVKPGQLTPLEYMLGVVNDESADEARRDRMAQAAAPYVHAKPGDQPKGKKEERQEAAEQAAGRFAVPSGPKLVVSNR